MKFLFDPIEVAERLTLHPRLSDALWRPHEAGEPSASFAKARKSAREIFRVLGNVHYPNLGQLLKSLEFCLAHGFSQPTLMRTRSRKPFVEALAELHAAEHFLLRGFTVEGQDTTKGSDSVPDMVIRAPGIELA